MRRGEIKLLHLAAHGNFRPDNINESPLQLENGELLRPSELAGARVAGLRRQRPLVFLNACHSGQIDFALAGLGGWAEKMVSDIGVSAFIGTLWEVNDQLAAEFAVQFYDLLSAGKPLGEAFQAARQLVRSHDPANPTWLAYTLYADPNGTVTLGTDDRM
jgi:CHAT domain-containing protein